MINAIHIALSGLAAASKKIEAGASNIANLTTTGSLSDKSHPPYSARTTVQESVTDSEGNGLGVKSNVIPKSTPFVPAFSPDSPFADEDGIIGVPNVNLAEEAVNIQIAETAFKANIKIIEAAADLSDELLGIFDDEV